MFCNPQSFNKKLPVNPVTRIFFYQSADYYIIPILLIVFSASFQENVDMTVFTTETTTHL